MAKGSRGGKSSGGAKISKSLDAQARSLKARMDALQGTMKEYAQFTMQGGSGYDVKKAEKYYSTQKKFNATRVQYNKVLNKQAEQRRKATSQQKAFVNSYGEATKREITNTTYKRAMKRQEKAVLRNIGY